VRQAKVDFSGKL